MILTLHTFVRKQVGRQTATGATYVRVRASPLRIQGTIAPPGNSSRLPPRTVTSYLKTIRMCLALESSFQVTSVASRVS